MEDERLIKIETKLAYQEHTIRELNDVIYDQQKQIDRLNSTVTLLVNRLRELSETLPGNIPKDEKPPHY